MDNYNNDPKLIDELLHVRAENASLFSQINSFREMNEFLKQIITTMITTRMNV